MGIHRDIQNDLSKEHVMPRWKTNADLVGYPGASASCSEHVGLGVLAQAELPQLRRAAAQVAQENKRRLFTVDYWNWVSMLEVFQSDCVGG